MTTERDSQVVLVRPGCFGDVSTVHHLGRQTCLPDVHLGAQGLAAPGDRSTIDASAFQYM